VHHGVEDQEEAAVGFAAPHGIVGEQHHVPLAMGYVYDSRLFGDLITTADHATEKEFFLRGEAQDHAGEGFARGQEPPDILRGVFRDVDFLLTRRALGFFLRSDVGPSLNHVGIADRAATAGASCSCSFLPSLSSRAAEAGTDSDDRALAEVDVELV